MPSDEDSESLCVPFFKTAGEILEKSGTCLSEPVRQLTKNCKCSDDTATLWCCGCCWCIVPIFVVFWTVVGSILLVELIIIGIVGFIIGLCYVLVGVWPAFIVTGRILFISIIRAPFNLYYSLRIAYFTVMIRPGLKVITILLLPPLHLLFPVFTFLIVFVGGLCVSISVSFAGWPMKPWRKMSGIYNKFYQVYVVDTKKMAENYGHSSGVPEGWDGRVYGMPLDPITIIFGILITINALICVPIGFFVIITVKAVPMYLWIIWKSATEFSLPEMVKKYFKQIKKVANYDCCKAYNDWFKGYGECFPMKAKWCEEPCMMICLWWLVLLGIISWTVTLPLVILIPPFAYINVWLAVIFFPPVGYLLAWICVFVFPFIAYILAMVAAPFVAFRCPFIALRYNILLPGRLFQSIKIGFQEPFEICKWIDKHTSEICLGKWAWFDHSTDLSYVQRTEKWTEGVVKVQYWELYLAKVEKCKKLTLDRGWLAREDMECAMPNVTVSLPGLAILDILAESVRREAEQPGVKGLVWWNKDTQCNDSNRNRADNVIAHYWPKLDKVKEALRKLNEDNLKNIKKTKKSAVVQEQHTPESVSLTDIEKQTPETQSGSCWLCCCKKVPEVMDITYPSQMLVKEVFYMQAQLCAGDSEQSEELKTALARDLWDEEQVRAMNRVCALVSDIVYSLLRTDVMQKKFMALLAK